MSLTRRRNCLQAEGALTLPEQRRWLRWRDSASRWDPANPCPQSRPGVPDARADPVARPWCLVPATASSGLTRSVHASPAIAHGMQFRASCRIKPVNSNYSKEDISKERCRKHLCSIPTVLHDTQKGLDRHLLPNRKWNKFARRGKTPFLLGKNFLECITS